MNNRGDARDTPHAFSGDGAGKGERFATKPCLFMNN
jgi:hypothetical protein